MAEEWKNESDSDIESEEHNMNLNIGVPRLVMLNSSNFPSPKSREATHAQKKRFNFHSTQKSNQWESKKALDLTTLLSQSKSKCVSIASQLHLMNSRQLKGLNSGSKFKLRYQGMTGNVNVKLLGINYDSKFNLDEEEDDIAKLDFEFARSLLTVAELEQVLIESPSIVHVSTHGSHHYKAVDKENEFQIAFEEEHTLRALIDCDSNYSAYYAVVCLLFEMEINHFVQYGFDHNHINTSLRTYIWCNEEQFALLMNTKIMQLFASILERFGLYFRTRAQCIEIFWGNYRNDTTFDSSPHPPMEAFQLKSIYAHDEDVQEILKEINDDYNKSMGLIDNRSIAKSLKKHQKFSWEILSILLHRKLMNASAEPVDTDDTLWMKTEDIDSYLKDDDMHTLDDIKEEEKTVFLGYDQSEERDDMKGLTEEDLAAFFGSDDGDDDDDKQDINGMKGVTADEMNDFFGSEDADDDNDDDDDDDDNNSFFDGDDEDHRTTKVKYGNIMDLTREIKIIPNIDRGGIKTREEMKELIEKVSLFRHRLVKSIRKIPDIKIALLAKSRTASNIEIVRFENKWALHEAKKKIEKIRENPKYNHDYDILFRHISKADESTKHQVGFIKKMQEKVYRIDIKNKTDPISLMLRKHLKSKSKCKIKLLVLNGCHSFILGKIFSQYVENVICIHPFVKIWDSTATTFTRYFYSSLQEYTNPATPFRQSVLKSYNAARTYVAKQCSNDYACKSHSHSHNLNEINEQRMKLRQKRFNQLHLSEDWNELQSRINDPEQFKLYRMEMQKSGVLFDEALDDLYDDKTIKISNVSSDIMHQLREYLEDAKHGIHECKDKEIDDDMAQIDINEDFIQKAIYHNNEHYEELSVAYFKFKSSAHRRIAMKLLDQKQYDEELEFSDHILFKGAHIDTDDDFKANGYKHVKEWKDLGWNHRIVPRCCCSPHHPHLAQDKLILLQDGYIINSKLIDDLRQINVGLQQLRVSRDKRRQRKLAEEVREPAENGADSSILSSCSDELKVTKSMNNFGGDVDQKGNTFKNDLYFGKRRSSTKRASNNYNNFASKKKRRSGGNNFGTKKVHIKKNSFVFEDDKQIQNKPKHKGESGNFNIQKSCEKRNFNQF